MANNSAEVSTGKPRIAGAIFHGNDTVALPTDASSELDAGFENLGYVSEDGVTNANSLTSEDIKAWGGDIVQTTQTEKTDTFQFMLIQSRSEYVLKSIYGEDNVTGDIASGITVKSNAKEVPPSPWVIDMILADNTLKRIVIPRGKISELGDVVYNGTDPIGYQPTITALPDEDGNTHYEYIKQEDIPSA